MPGKVKWLWSINGSGVGNTSNFVTTNTNQTITGDKQFNGNVQMNNVVEIHNTTSQDNSLAIYRENTKANFISFFNGNTRQGFLGKAATSDTQLTLKAETGDLVLNCNDTSHSINVSNKNISNLAAPSQNNHAATKQYVDNTVYGNWTTIVNINSNIPTLNDNFTQIIDYTSFSNFHMNSGNTYEVMFKCNVESTDIYCTGICASNATSYDNVGFTNTMYWGDSNGIIFKFSLNNNRIKIWAKRNGNNNNWNTHTRVYIRKIMSGGIQ